MNGPQPRQLPVTQSWVQEFRPWLTRGGGVLGLALFLWWAVFRSSGHSYAPGQLIQTQPIQTKVVKGSIAKEGYAITPLYEFELKARVLGAERYRFDPNASLSPYDLALGWGVMSDQAYLDRLTIRQGGRFYSYSWGPEANVSGNAIAVSSANMHMIPATDEVEDVLGDIRQGDIVHLYGYLVHVTTPEGFSWRSSTTRNDRGNGACEVVYVEEVEIITDEYQPL